MLFLISSPVLTLIFACKVLQKLSDVEVVILTVTAIFLRVLQMAFIMPGYFVELRGNV